MKVFDSIRAQIFDTEPLLLTHKWLQYANRIRHRVATNGITDKSFMNDVLKQVVIISTQTDVADEVTYDAAQVTRLYFTNSLKYRPVSLDNLPSQFDDVLDKITRQAMEQVLKEYEMEAQGTWKRALHDGGSSIVEILINSKIRYAVESARVLTFDPTMRIWGSENISLSG